jgi:hypothetical protein
MCHLGVSHCFQEDPVLHQVNLADSGGDDAWRFEQLDQPNPFRDCFDQHDVIHDLFIIQVNSDLTHASLLESWSLPTLPGGGVTRPCL